MSRSVGGAGIALGIALGIGLAACGGQAAHVRERAPRYVIGDHSVRPWPDPLEHALERWLVATDAAPGPIPDWGGSDEEGAAELRGVALGRGARARVAAHALELMSAAHRAFAVAPAGSTSAVGGAAHDDLRALHDLVRAVESVPDDADPGFAAAGRALALDCVTAALAEGPASPEDAARRVQRILEALGQPAPSTTVAPLPAAIAAYASRASELAARDARLRARVERAARAAARAAERWEAPRPVEAEPSALGASEPVPPAQ